jgi:hypothetical protein
MATIYKNLYTIDQNLFKIVACFGVTDSDIYMVSICCDYKNKEFKNPFPISGKIT